MKFVLTVSQCNSEVDAQRFFVSEIFREFGKCPPIHFKRTLLHEPDIQAHVTKRLQVLDRPLDGPISAEFVWLGNKDYLLYAILCNS